MEPEQKPEPQPEQKPLEIEDIPEVAHKVGALMMCELNLRVKSAITLAAAMLVMGVDFTDEQLATRAVGITDKILEKINI